MTFTVCIMVLTIISTKNNIWKPDFKWNQNQNQNQNKQHTQITQCWNFAGSNENLLISDLAIGLKQYVLT